MSPVGAGSAGTAGPGLVSSAITRTPLDSLVDDLQEIPSPAEGERTSGLDLDAELAGLLGSVLSFPSADLVRAAVSMFPTPELRVATQGSAPLVDYNLGDARRLETHGVAVQPSTRVMVAAMREGQWPRIEVGPGVVVFRRVDVAAEERTAERLRGRQRRFVDEVVRAMPSRVVTVKAGASSQRWDMPKGYDDEMESEFAATGETPRRDIVSDWSAKSRSRLVKKIACLDLAPLVTGATPPVMVTLTLPGDWLAVMPDAETAARKFDNWTRLYRKRWGMPLRAIWKREFQRRGAPHWHLWMVPPTANLPEFRLWLSKSWTGVLGLVPPPGCVGKLPQQCSCSEYCRSLGAGTGVDMAEGMRARDPKRLALYFLKESLGGEGKAYQNKAPSEWAGQSVGRFWGVRGIADAVETAELDPRDYAQLWRSARRVRDAGSGIREQAVQRVNTRTGEVRLRKVRRRVKTRSAAGFVCVNDGAAFAADLGRYAALLADYRATALVNSDSPSEV